MFDVGFTELTDDKLEQKWKLVEASTAELLFSNRKKKKVSEIIINASNTIHLTIVVNNTLSLKNLHIYKVIYS